MTNPSTTAPERLRILWVNCRLLHPLNGGDRIRTYNMLRQLKLEHQVTYLAFRTPTDPPEATERAREFCHELITVPYQPVINGTLKFYLQAVRNSLFSDVPYYAERYRSVKMEQHIHELAAAGKVDLIVADYLASMIHLTGGRRRPAVPVLIFQHNVESQIWKRHAETAGNFIRRAIFRRQWRLTCDWESECDDTADGQVSVSADDCQFFRQELGLKKILGDVPTGVDLELFSPPTTPRKPRSLVFLGSMDWMANIDGTVFFTEEILPLVRQQFPDVRLTIVGRNPARKVRELERFAGVRVTGTVDDVRPFLAEASAMIVPLRVGGGTRIKIFEGMATGIPVISTRIGAEGLPVTHGEDILLADTPQDFTAQVAALFGDPQFAERLGSKGRVLVTSQFSWESVNRIFVAHCRQAYELGRQRSTTHPAGKS